MSPINSTDLDKLSAAITSSMATGFAQLQQALVSTIQQTQVVVTPKATTKQHYTRFLGKGQTASPSDLADKDRRILSIFAKRGFRNVVLKDRASARKASLSLLRLPILRPPTRPWPLRNWPPLLRSTGAGTVPLPLVSVMRRCRSITRG
jgi:hypothetical protein